MEGTELETELAGQITRFMKGLEFPAEKAEITTHAQQEQAGSTLLSALEKLPDGTYSTPDEVAERLTGARP